MLYNPNKTKQVFFSTSLLIISGYNPISHFFVQRKDFLQLMVNAHEEDNAHENTKQEKDDQDLHSVLDEHHNTSFHESEKTQKLMLTLDEVFAQVQ